MPMIIMTLTALLATTTELNPIILMVYERFVEVGLVCAKKQQDIICEVLVRILVFFLSSQLFLAQ